MRLGVRPLSLSRRIVASTALGLGLILVLFGLVALWTIQESTDAAYRERVTLAQALARRVDDVLRYTLVTFDREAATLNLNEVQPPDAAQIERLDELHQRMAFFNTLAVVNMAGLVVWVDPHRFDIAIGSEPRQPCVETALQMRRPAITGLVLPGEGPNGGSSAACLAVPLTDAEGRPAGALMAELNLSHPALALLPSMDGGEGMPLDLVSMSGRVLASNHGQPGAMEAVHQHLLTGFMMNRTAGYVMHDPRPWEAFGSHIVAYAPLSLLPSWGVVIEQPKDVAVAVPQRIRWRLGIFGLAALLLAAAVAWADVRQVVRPVRYLTTAAERFAAGYLDVPIQLERVDELGILARAFETMRQRLRASLAEVAEWNRELERRVASRTAEVERRNRELAHLNEIAAAVSGSLDVRAMLARTLEHVLQITAADVGSFRVVEGESGRLTLAAEHGLTAVFGDGRSCDDTCLCERAVRHNTVVAAEDAAELDALRCRPANLEAALAVPLPAGDRVQGVLFLGWQHAGRRQQVELTTLDGISRQVGIALSNARLYESLRGREHERAELLQRVMAGQEEERRRLAQELHDETSQALASLQLGLERLAGDVHHPEQARQLAEQLQGIAAQTLADVHRLAVELRPSVLDDIGLVAAIERYLLESAKRWNLPVDCAAVGMDGVRLIPAAETVVYRIVQAALTNTVQHAEAKHVSVLLERRHQKLVVVVEDDGRGFDLEATRNATLEKRLGLAGMDERADLIGATLTIETAPGAGTTVFLEVPVEPNLRREEPDVEAPNRTG